MQRVCHFQVTSGYHHVMNAHYFVSRTHRSCPPARIVNINIASAVRSTPRASTSRVGPIASIQLLKQMSSLSFRPGMCLVSAYRHLGSPHRHYRRPDTASCSLVRGFAAWRPNTNSTWQATAQLGVLMSEKRSCRARTTFRYVGRLGSFWISTTWAPQAAHPVW